MPVGRARIVQLSQRPIEIGETVHKLCEVVGGDRHVTLSEKTAAILRKTTVSTNFYHTKATASGNTAGPDILEGDVWKALQSVTDIVRV